MIQPRSLSPEQIANHRDAAAVALHFLAGDPAAAVALLTGKSELERGGILVALAQQLGTHLTAAYGPDGAQEYLRRRIEQLMNEELAAMVRQAQGAGGARSWLS